MLCAYATVKYVEIHDTRLVCLRYILLLAIALYVVVFEMIAMGGWLEPSPVVGVVRFSLQQPTVDNCDPLVPTCKNAFAPLNTLPYCEQYYSYNRSSTPPPTNYNGKIMPCEIYEASNAQVLQEKSLTVITRASTVQQKFVCPSNETMTCPRTYDNLSDEYKFYTAQSESFTVLVDHAVTASKICSRHQHSAKKGKHDDSGKSSITSSYACSAESSSYPGRLYSINDHLCQHEHLVNHNAFSNYRGSTETAHAPCYISPNRTKPPSNQDFFSLDVLLQAAGVTLDDCNNDMSTTNTSSADGQCQTYRDSGATLLLNIYWNDFVPYQGLVEPHYFYKPQLVARSAFKQTIPFYDNHYRERRTLLNAHGIRVAVLLGGEFNQFNIVTFMVTLTTALGLLAVATTIVDSLMLYVLPEKDRYQQVKYEQTAEVFQANDVVSSTVAGLGHLLAVNNNNGSSQTRQRINFNHQDNPDHEADAMPSDNHVESTSTTMGIQLRHHAEDGTITEPLLSSHESTS